jgi:exosortase/archaeosortase family protein
VGSHSYGMQWPGTVRRSGAGPGRHASGPGRKRQPDLGYVPAAFQLASVTSWRRALTSSLLCASTALILVFQYRFRHAEAMAAAFVYNLVTPTLAATKAPIVWFGLGRPGAFGLVITPDCSAALLLVPLLMLGMALVLPVRLPLRRVIGALGVAAGLLVIGNLLRIGAIAVAVRVAGPGLGYQIGHLIIGSAISVVFIGASLILMTFIITSRPSDQGPKPLATTSEDSRG